MIQINPPVNKPYAPASQLIAFVAVTARAMETVQGARPFVGITLLDVNKNPILVNTAQVPLPTPAQLAAFEAAPAQAGDSFTQDACRRALPYIQAVYGLTGTILPAATVAIPKSAPAPVPAVTAKKKSA